MMAALDRLPLRWRSSCTLFLLSLLVVFSCAYPPALLDRLPTVTFRNRSISAIELPPQDWQLQGILAALTDADAGVRGIAFTQVRGKDFRSVKERFAIAKQAIASLKDPHIAEDDRWGAALALGNLGDATSPHLKYLGDLLRDRHTQTGGSGEAAYILGNLGTAATPYLNDLLELAKYRGVSDHESLLALAAVAQLDTPATPYGKELLKIAQDPTIEPSLRSSALNALGKSQTVANYAKDLSKILKDRTKNPLTPCSAVEVLGKLGDAATPYVLDIWNFFTDRSLDTSTHYCAARALTDLHSAAEPYAEYFLTIVKNASAPTDERQQAAQLLGNLGSTTLGEVRDLVALLKDPHTQAVVRIAIAKTLGNLDVATQPYFPDFWAIVRSNSLDRDLRAATVSAFGRSATATKALLTILTDPSSNPMVRDAAIAALDNVGAAVRPYAREIVEIATKQGGATTQDRQLDRPAGGYGLKNLGNAAQPFTQELLAIVRDRRYQFSVRSSAAVAIFNSGKSAKPHIKDLIPVVVETIERSPGDMNPLYAIESAQLPLDQLAPLSAADLCPIVKLFAGSNRELGRQYSQFMSYFYSGGNRATITKFRSVSTISMISIEPP